WPGYWANSCCSHPRRGETDGAGADRRIREELGIAPTLHYLFKFRYQVRYGDLGAEHELCSVYAAVSDAAITVNHNEVADTRRVSSSALDRELTHRAQDYTPWLALEWPRIRSDHWSAIERLVAG
ncbi:MAG: NUDIX domain-containing protein, partial [Salinisphaera sp.]|nr:NUDIX domain-containing protein [Salinisphaera sp.]